MHIIIDLKFIIGCIIGYLCCSVWACIGFYCDIPKWLTIILVILFPFSAIVVCAISFVLWIKGRKVRK